MFEDSPFNSDISEWKVSKNAKITLMFKGSKFLGSLKKWQLNEEALSEAFGSSLDDYTIKRHLIEEHQLLSRKFSKELKKIKRNAL